MDFGRRAFNGSGAVRRGIHVMYLHRAPKLTENDTLVLTDFENKTGDPVFDDTLRQGFVRRAATIAIAHPAFGPEEVQQTLEFYGTGEERIRGADA